MENGVMDEALWLQLGLLEVQQREEIMERCLMGKWGEFF